MTSLKANSEQFEGRLFVDCGAIEASPRSIKTEFIKKCYEYKKSFALLLPLTALEGVERSIMFSEYGIELLVFDKRIDFTGKKACWFNTSWFCHSILPEKLMFCQLKENVESEKLF